MHDCCGTCIHADLRAAATASTLLKTAPCLNYDLGRCPVSVNVDFTREYRKTVQMAMVFQVELKNWLTSWRSNAKVSRGAELWVGSADSRPDCWTEVVECWSEGVSARWHCVTGCYRPSSGWATRLHSARFVLGNWWGGWIRADAHAAEPGFCSAC